MTQDYQDNDILKTEHAKLSVHNKAQICPNHAWIVSDQQGRDTLDFFKSATVDQLRDVFSLVASVDSEQQSRFILFHAVRPGDDVQNTNSKLPNLHIHVFTNDFADAFSHIADPAVKSYVVKPNTDLAGSIAKQTQDLPKDRFVIASLDESTGAEAKVHDVLMRKDFKTFTAFVSDATDAQWNEFRVSMINLIEPWVQEGRGGARVVIDERYLDTGCLTVQLLAGENLDRSGDNKQRYFQKPSV